MQELVRISYRNILQILTTTILQWAHGLFTNIDYNYFTNRVTVSYNRVQQARLRDATGRPDYIRIVQRERRTLETLLQPFYNCLITCLNNYFTVAVSCSNH